MFNIHEMTRANAKMWETLVDFRFWHFPFNRVIEKIPFHCRFCQLPSNGIITKIAIRDLDLLFGGDQF